MRFRIARLAALATAALLRLAGRSGTTVPGRVALAIEPSFLAGGRRRIRGPVALVSATNGKTTTSALAAAALRSLGEVSTNAEGANMEAGIAASLAACPIPSAAGLFEVDEFWLPDVGRSLAPDVVLLGNLFRDQLDRYGELDTILERWSAASVELAARGTRFVACADDPGIVHALRDVDEARIEWFGLAAPAAALGRLPHAADAPLCRSCGGSLDYCAIYLGHLGGWSCPACGARRPDPGWSVTSFEPSGARGFRIRIEEPGSVHDLELRLPGLYNAFNALAAWTLVRSLGIPADRAEEAFRAAEPAFGRGERLSLGASEVQLMLVKNPTGANEVIRSLAAEPSGQTVVFALNDRVADGRDVSWIWDADFELLAPLVGELWCSGTRADEAALRFKYAGVPTERISVRPDTRAALAAATRSADRVWVLPTYTAMIELRSQLSDEGVVERVV